MNDDIIVPSFLGICTLIVSIFFAGMGVQNKIWMDGCYEYCKPMAVDKDLTSEKATCICMDNKP